jgi:hypothetical protein
VVKLQDFERGKNIPYQMTKNEGIHAGWAILDQLMKMGRTKWFIAKELGVEWSTVRKWQLRSNAPNYFSYQKLVTLLEREREEDTHRQSMSQRYKID